jgi:hypothetical protein
MTSAIVDTITPTMLMPEMMFMALVLFFAKRYRRAMVSANDTLIQLFVKDKS